MEMQQFSIEDFLQAVQPVDDSSWDFTNHNIIGDCSIEPENQKKIWEIQDAEPFGKTPESELTAAFREYVRVHTLGPRPFATLPDSEKERMIERFLAEQYALDPGDDNPLDDQGCVSSFRSIFEDNLGWILNNPSFTDEQKHAASNIAACRTVKLGMHVEYCPKCNRITEVHYNSCNNRCCPNCQTTRMKIWEAARINELIPDEQYAHIILTVPHELNLLFADNRAKLGSLLLKCASQSVIEMCQGMLGITPGVTSVQHTWNQRLEDHWHVHLWVSCGGLNEKGRYLSIRQIRENRRQRGEYLKNLAAQAGVSYDESFLGDELLSVEGATCVVTNGQVVQVDSAAASAAMSEEVQATVEDIKAENELMLQEAEEQLQMEKTSSGDYRETEGKTFYFLPLRALTALFQGKMISEIFCLLRKHELVLSNKTKKLDDLFARDQLRIALEDTSWVGHIRVVAGQKMSASVVHYLSNYIFRIAITEARIHDYDGKNVTIYVRDNQHVGKYDLYTLSAKAFIRRFLNHVPPKNFTRVRFSGFLSNSKKTKALKSIHEQLALAEYEPCSVSKMNMADAMKYLHMEKRCKCCNTLLKIFRPKCRTAELTGDTRDTA